jgi:hypothetical protein
MHCAEGTVYRSVLIDGKSYHKIRRVSEWLAVEDLPININVAVSYYVAIMRSPVLILDVLNVSQSSF